MANSLLTPTVITRELQRVLHNNLTFTKTVNRQYDNRFAQSGAKIGTTLQVRRPNQYTVTTGAAMNVQDVAETYDTITCATQKHVDFSFTAADLTMTIDEFSDRYLKPAGLLLASTIDADGLALAADIYNLNGTATSVPNALLTFLEGSAFMTNGTTPQSPRNVAITPLTYATMVDALKGLHNPNATIGKQNVEGSLGKFAGLDWSQTQNIRTHTPGTRTASGETTTNGATASGATTIVCTTGSGKTFAAGDVFTFVSGTAVYGVNPETKASTGVAQQFVVTAAATAASTDVTLSISPAIITSGARQTVTAVPDASAQLTFIGAASTAYKDNLIYHPDAFTLVTADLQLPSGTDFAAREVFDGISVRLIRDYNITNDTFPCRLDVYYGWKTLEPRYACRIVGSK